MLVAIVAAAAAASVRDGPIPPNPVTLELYHVNQANYTWVSRSGTLHVGSLGCDRSVGVTCSPADWCCTAEGSPT